MLGQTQAFQGGENEAERQLRMLLQGTFGEQADLQRELQGTYADRRADAERTLEQLGALTSGGDVADSPFVEGINLGGDDPSGDEAEALAFARAAERQADLTQGGERALEQDLQSRGFGAAGAGGVGAELAESVRGQGRSALSQMLSEQAASKVARQREVADRNLQASLAERGQDVTQRGQNINRTQSILAQLLGGRGLY